jgi:hypothetical protein
MQRILEEETSHELKDRNQGGEIIQRRTDNGKLLWEKHITKASPMIMNSRPTLYCNKSLLQKLWYGMEVPQPHATSSRKLSTTSDGVLFDNSDFL